MLRPCGLSCLAIVALISPAGGEEYVLHSFDVQPLTDVYYSEGANAGDINGDGLADIVYGPYWFAGPAFTEKKELYPAKPQNRDFYADNFFNWIYDFDGDGRNDVFTVGFPGKPAYVYQNPGPEGLDKPWPRHEVFDIVNNESPHFTNLVGDERPELVCSRGGFFGYARFDPSNPFATWPFHPISGPDAPKQFGHGLGVGDVNGDGRLDVLSQKGWYEQPEGNAEGRWKFHPVPFAERGGAEMHVYDVNGDGANDVITSLEAHEFGLAWYEQVRTNKSENNFRRHLIMGTRPEENRYGLVFTEPHSVALADMDGDGQKDIVTGKTYWSHHRQSPMWDAGAVVYWFRLVRGPTGVDWVPYQAAADTGIGRQVSVVDVNADGLPDIVVGGMKGAHALLHKRASVSKAEYDAAQPKPYDGPPTLLKRGPKAALDPATGRVAGALEGETLKVLEATAGKTQVQDMSKFLGVAWSGSEQLFWTGGKPGARLDLELPVDQAGTYDLEAVLTMASDYGVVQVSLDDKPLGEPLDCFYHWNVITTGVLNFGRHELTAGPHKLSLEIKGANRAALPAYLVGLDFVRLSPVDAAAR